MKIVLVERLELALLRENANLVIKVIMVAVEVLQRVHAADHAL